MVVSKKPGAAKPVDQFISLIKTSDQKEVAAQKTVAKGSAEKKTEDTSEKKASASTSTVKRTKMAKPAAKPLDSKNAPVQKTADTEPMAKKTEKKRESRPANRPTSAWPFPSSGSKS